MTGGVAPDATLRANGIGGCPNTMGISAEVRRVTRPQLSESASLAAGEGAFTFVDRWRMDAEDGIGAQIVD